MDYIVGFYCLFCFLLQNGIYCKFSEIMRNYRLFEFSVDYLWIFRKESGDCGLTKNMLCQTRTIYKFLLGLLSTCFIPSFPENNT